MISKEDWKSFSNLIREFQTDMLKGWPRELELRHMLYVWLQDHDMPCPQLNERRVFMGNNTFPGNGIAGIAVDDVVEFKFDAESGLIQWLQLPYLYFGHAPTGQGQPGSAVFLLRIECGVTANDEFKIWFTMRGRT